MAIIAKRFYGPAMHEVQSAPTGTLLPTQPLYIPPGNYTFQGQHFNCSTEGLYRFVDHGRRTEQRIVHSTNLYAFMSAMCWITCHGRGHDRLTPPQLNGVAMRSKLRLGCGGACTYVRYWLNWLRIPNRLCSLLTADEPTGYFDGHVAIEVHDGAAWRLWDINRAQYFMRDGQHLSLYDSVPLTHGQLVEYLDSDSYAIEDYAGGFDATMFMELEDRLPAQRWGWTERVYQIPGIHTPGGVYFYLPAGTEHREAWVTSKGYQVISEGEWLQMFY